MATLKKFSPVTPLSVYWTELGVSLATGKKRLTRDPDFPRNELVQVGVNRLGITLRGKSIYQQVLAERAMHAMRSHAVPSNLGDPRRAAAKSAEVRRRNAEARRAARTNIADPR